MWYDTHTIAGNDDISTREKEIEKSVEKTEKKVLTKSIPGGIIFKLSGARATRKAAENRITTAFEDFSGASVLEKTSKKSQKSS